MHTEKHHFSVRKSWILFFPDKIKKKGGARLTSVNEILFHNLCQKYIHWKSVVTSFSQCILTLWNYCHYSVQYFWA